MEPIYSGVGDRGGDCLRGGGFALWSVNFNKVCRIEYHHLKYQINTCAILDIENFLNKTWSKLMKLDFLKKQHALYINVATNYEVV
jgi:hypothetical protein